MRKGLLAAISIFLCFTLSSCGKSEAAKKVDDMILGIGEVTLESKEKIDDVENAVNTLDRSDYRHLENLSVLEKAKDTYAILQASEVVAAIDEIKAGDLENADTITHARNMYEMLDELAKEKVTNYPSLERAEHTLSKLKIENAVNAIDSIGDVSYEKEALINNARKAYSALSAEEKEEISNYNLLVEAKQTLSDIKVQHTIDAIDEIGEVTLDSEGLITKARVEYNSLTSAEQQAVTNSNVLEEASSRLSSLKSEKKEQAKLESLSTLESEIDKVMGITWYKPSEFPTYINTRSFVLPYIGQDDDHFWLRLRVNYAGDNWVFFNKIILSIDGENRTKSFNYFDVIRDNAGGTVGEYIDFAPTNTEIEMLKSIVDSKETIVRFQGDERLYDLTVSSEDKAAIQEVLDAYKALKN